MNPNKDWAAQLFCVVLLFGVILIVLQFAP